MHNGFEGFRRRESDLQLLSAQDEVLGECDQRRIHPLRVTYPYIVSRIQETSRSLHMWCIQCVHT